FQRTSDLLVKEDKLSFFAIAYRLDGISASSKWREAATQQQLPSTKLFSSPVSTRDYGTTWKSVRLASTPGTGGTRSWNGTKLFVAVIPSKIPLGEPTG